MHKNLSTYKCAFVRDDHGGLPLDGSVRARSTFALVQGSGLSGLGNLSLSLTHPHSSDYSIRYKKAT